MVFLVLYIGHKQFVSVYILTYAQKLVTMQVHVAHFIGVITEESTVCENELEAVVEQALLVKG